MNSASCARKKRSSANGTATSRRRCRIKRPLLLWPERIFIGPGSVGFLGWTVPPTTAPALVERLAAHARRVVFLSSPHQTPHPFFQQPNPMALLHADIERLIAAAGLESTIIRPGMFASNVLFWWAAAIRADGVLRWPYGAAGTAPVYDGDVAARPGRCMRTAMLAATTSSRALSH
jgi:hypothetical protein